MEKIEPGVIFSFSGAKSPTAINRCLDEAINSLFGKWLSGCFFLSETELSKEFWLRDSSLSYKVKTI